jgi:GPH family glycoside/pentoside/hexuronide:cation symporter
VRKLSAAAKTAYAAPAFALAVVGIPVYVYIPKFYTDVVGVHISALGAILLIVRLFDAFTDPVIGIFSDRLKTPMGRRRPLIAAGAVLTVIAIAFLFNPPRQISADAAGFYFMALIFALFLFWTIVIVPYEALGPELTFDYSQRISLFSVRDGALIAGTVIAAAMPGAVRWATGTQPGASGERQIFFILSLIYIPLILGACAWCVAVFRERPRPEKAAELKISQWIHASLANRPFRILLIAYTISAIGNNLPATLILYYVQYVLHSPRADLFLALYFITGIVFMWVYLARKTGKKAAWIASMAINTGAFFWVFFLGSGDEMLYGILVFISGIGFGATLAIPSAIQADVIDYDELVAGDRREGLYISLWSIAKKLAAAAGVGAGLALLGASGYRPGIIQSDSVVFTLRVLYALIPCLCNAIAIVIALYYPISEDIHLRIRRAIEERAAGRTVENPLMPGQIIGRQNTEQV